MRLLFLHNFLLSLYENMFGTFRFLEPKAARMDFWGQALRTRRRPRRTVMSLIDQFLFVLIRLKVRNWK